MKNLRHGFTIIEIMVVIGIMSLILTGITAFMLYSFNSYSFSFKEYGAIELVQGTMTRITRDIREIRMGDNGAWPIAETNDNSFTFYSDVNNDGKAEKVRYFLDGTDFKRGVIVSSGSPLSYLPGNENISYIASYVANGADPVFRYYNGNWPADQTNNPLSPTIRLVGTRYVTVYLKINTKPEVPTGAFELSTGINIRSMKDNL